ncbi:hypothetical protein [Nitrospira sp. BLG_2]|uniref:hypothetical protein n=1 Tax=Nitrospira sp. BLG_2 TaxID=3397507 RepID=UPI003B9CC9FF
MNAPESGTDNTITGELVFFSIPRLELINYASVTRGEEKRALTDYQQVAAYLLGDPDQVVTAKDLLVAPVSTEARFRRAQLMVRDIERQEASTAEPIGLRDSWKFVEREWRWVADAPVIRRKLIDYAAACGFHHPENLAKVVLSRVQDELLPLLHLKWYFVAGTDSRRIQLELLHAEFLDQYRISSKTSEAVTELYSSYVLSELQNYDVGSDVPYNKIVVLLTTHELQKREVLKICEATTRYQAETLKAWLSSTPTLSALDKRLEAYTTLLESGQPHMPLLELIAGLHFARYQNLFDEQRDIDGALRELTLALSYDPFNGQASERFHGLAEDIANLEQRLASKKNGSPQTDPGAELLQQLKHGYQKAASFSETSEGRRIAQLWNEALQRELPRRLGLDPLGPETSTLAATFISSVDEAGQSGTDSELFVHQVRALAITRDSRLVELDWVTIGEGLVSAPCNCGALIALHLKPPNPPEEPALLKDFRREMSSMLERPPTSSAGHWLRAVAWLLSGRDVLVKAMVGLALLLLVHGVWATTSRIIRDRADDQMYSTILASAANVDDDLLIATAKKYLSVDGGHPDEPRRHHATKLLQEAIFRKVVRLVDQGLEQDANQLLETLEQWTTLASQTETARK